jgi:hypothetical protein
VLLKYCNCVLTKSHKKQMQSRMALKTVKKKTVSCNNMLQQTHLLLPSCYGVIASCITVRFSSDGLVLSMI